MEQLTLWSEEVPANPSPSQESEKVLRELLDSCSSTYVVFKSLCLGGSCGRTSRERSRVRGGRLSDSCSEKWMPSGTVWRGEYWTRSSSAWPKGANVSFLSDTLETRAPAKYSLSRKACAGILRRAENRGKPLPPLLDAALRKVAEQGA